MKRKRTQFAEHGGQARVLAVVGLRLFYPLVAFLVAVFATLFILPTQLMARQYAMQGCAMMIGVSPTGMQISNLPQSRVNHYDKEFVKNLKPNTPFLRCAERRELPEMSGNTHVLFMYNAMTANIAQAAEGTVGQSAQVSVANNSTLIGNFADYVNLSTLARLTAIDPALDNIQRELALRLGLNISTLCRNTADGASVIDSAVNANSKLANVPFGKGDVTTAVQSMAGRNVMPFDRARYCGVIHPFIVGDTVNDNSNNSLTDALKHTVEGQMALKELAAPDGDEVQVMDWAGATFYQSTIVTQTANYLSSGKTALRTYLFGQDGIIAISLGKKAQAQIGNGDWRNLKLWINKYDAPSVSDPSLMIGGSTAYNVNFAVTLPPDLTMRLRVIDAVSNVS